MGKPSADLQVLHSSAPSLNYLPHMQALHRSNRSGEGGGGIRLQLLCVHMQASSRSGGGVRHRLQLLRVQSMKACSFVQFVQHA